MAIKYGKKKAETPEDLLKNAIEGAIEGMRISGSLTGHFSKSDSDRLMKALKETLLKYKSATIESTKILNDVISKSGSLTGKPKAEKILRDIFDQAREESGLKEKEDKKRDKILKDIHRSAKEFNDSTSKNLEALNDKMGVRGYLERKDKPIGKFLDIYEQIKKRDGKQGFSPISLIKAFGSLFSNSKIFKFLGFSLGWFGRFPALIGYKIGSIFEDYKKHNADVWDTQKEYYKRLLEEGHTKRDIKSKMQSLPGGLEGNDYTKMASEAFQEYIADANRMFRVIASDLALSKYKTPEGKEQIAARAEEAGINPNILKYIKSENKYMRELKKLMKGQKSEGQRFEVSETQTKATEAIVESVAESGSYLQMIFEELKMLREDLLNNSFSVENHLLLMRESLGSVIEEFKLFREDYLRELLTQEKGAKEKGKGLFGKILEMLPGFGLLSKLFKGGGLIKGLVGFGAGLAATTAALGIAAYAGWKFGKWLDKTLKLGDRFTSLFTAPPETEAENQKRNQKMVELSKQWREAIAKGDKEEVKKIQAEQNRVLHGVELDKPPVIKELKNIIKENKHTEKVKSQIEKEVLKKITEQGGAVDSKQQQININTPMPARLDTVPSGVEDIALRTFSEGFLR